MQPCRIKSLHILEEIWRNLWKWLIAVKNQIKEQNILLKYSSEKNSIYVNCDPSFFSVVKVFYRLSPMISERKTSTFFLVWFWVLSTSDIPQFFTLLLSVSVKLSHKVLGKVLAGSFSFDSAKGSNKTPWGILSYS